MLYAMRLEEDEFETSDIPTTTIRSKADIADAEVQLPPSRFHAIVSSPRSPALFASHTQRFSQASTNEIVLDKLVQILTQVAALTLLTVRSARAAALGVAAETATMQCPLRPSRQLELGVSPQPPAVSRRSVMQDPRMRPRVQRAWLPRRAMTSSIVLELT